MSFGIELSSQSKTAIGLYKCGLYLGLLGYFMIKARVSRAHEHRDNYMREFSEVRLTVRINSFNRFAV